MKLLSSLAHRIVDKVTHIVNEEVIVVDDQGMIIATSDKARIGDFHEGAFIAIRDKKTLNISEKDVFRLQGVKAGLNLPIIISKNVIGVIGITGEHDRVVQFGQLIQRMTELIIQEAHISERLESKYRGLETFVYEWVQLIELDQDFMDRGDILRISMFLPRICVLFELKVADLDEGHDRLIESEVIDQIRKQFDYNQEDLVVRWGNGRFVLLKCLEKPNDMNILKRKLEESKREVAREQNLLLFIGVGKIGPHPKDLHQSNLDAKKSIKGFEKTTPNYVL